MALAKIKEIEAKYSAEIIEKIKKLYELTDDAGYISVKSGVDYYDTLEILGIEFGGEKYHAMISREHDAKVRGLIAQNRDEIYELLHSLGNNHDAEVLAYIQRKRLAEKRKIEKVSIEGTLEAIASLRAQLQAYEAQPHGDLKIDSMRVLTAKTLAEISAKSLPKIDKILEHLRALEAAAPKEREYAPCVIFKAPKEVKVEDPTQKR